MIHRALFGGSIDIGIKLVGEAWLCRCRNYFRGLCVCVLQCLLTGQSSPNSATSILPEDQKPTRVGEKPESVRRFGPELIYFRVTCDIR